MNTLTYDTLKIKYWSQPEEQDMGYKHNATYPYTDLMRNSVMDQALSKGFNVLLEQRTMDGGETLLTIWIDRNKFGLRNE